MVWAMRLFVLHAYAVLFGWVLIEQGGLPIPSIPLMVAAGTMSSAHKLYIPLALFVIMFACLLADSLWWWLGRQYGSRVLNLLCKFSLEAATCVTKTQSTVSKRGGLTLLFAKWVPGLSTMAAPIAGQAGVPYGTFVVYDMAGTLLWAAAWLLAGRFFGDAVERSHKLFGTLEHWAGLLVLAAVLGVIVYRVAKRQQFRSELRGLRLEPHQLIAMMEDAAREGQEPPFIVDLRHPLDVLANPEVVRGAVRIVPDELVRSKDLIPVGRDVILYCTCPSEETSAKIAMELRRLGVKKVRPLRGGLQGWKDAGLPMDIVTL